MTIDWSSNFLSSTSEVKYGTSSSELTFSRMGSYSQYSFDGSYFGKQSDYTSGFLHTVYLTDLKASTQYFYQCGDFESGNTSSIRSFTTLPEAGSEESILFGVIADLGQTADSKSTLQHIAQNPGISMVLLIGDLGYADCEASLWDSFGELISMIASDVPLMIGAGDHEIELNDPASMNADQTFTAFEKRFHMPGDKPAEFGAITYNPRSNNIMKCGPTSFAAEYNYGNSFFSFEVGLVHYIFLNSYSVSSYGSVQYAWLRQDLRAVNRRTTPWVIVGMHNPWYNSNEVHHQGEAETSVMQYAMEDLMFSYGVNLVLAGHVHAYERTYPVFQNITIPIGITYINIGDGGNAEGHHNQYIDPAPAWSAFRNGSQYGHGELLVINKTHLFWEWHRNVDGEVVFKDQIYICNSLFMPATCSNT